MRIIKVTKYITDCFIGEGWENWVRFNKRSDKVLGKSNVSSGQLKFVIRTIKEMK